MCIFTYIGCLHFLYRIKNIYIFNLICLFSGLETVVVFVKVELCQTFAFYVICYKIRVLKKNPNSISIMRNVIIRYPLIIQQKVAWADDDLKV